MKVFKKEEGKSSLERWSETISLMSGLQLIRVETWITTTTHSEDNCGAVKPFLFVRLTNNDETVGWGEAFVNPCREKAVAEIIHALTQAALTGDAVTPFSFQKLAYQISGQHRGLDYMAATSAIEIALWDLAAKQLKMPLCDLLGAKGQREIAIYANYYSRPNPTIETYLERAKVLMAQGFRAIKIHPLQISNLKAAADCVLQLKAFVGDDIDLMLDLGGPQNPDQSRQFMALIAPFKPYWLEEPADGEDIQSLVNIRQSTSQRIMTGEKHSGVPHFRSLLAAGAADILNPDIAGVGGILDLLEIAAMAHSKDVSVSPHCWNSMTIAAAAMLHVCCAIPNAEMAEIYPEFLAHGARMATNGFAIENGRAMLSERPGLGVEINEKALFELSAHYQMSDLIKPI